MSTPIITVENLSKRYRLGVIGATTLRESFERWWHRTRGRDPDAEMGVVGPATNRRQSSSSKSLQSAVSSPLSFQVSSLSPSVVWALRDISFEVQRGEVLGIIGRNGAGKSTLLKILCRITEPTRGRAILRGRVGSLLEVGTGFHPELTGRENVYLNGAILGMRHAEITRKFDEIVDFSGVERFVDTPVKRYSSGMKVRLAFAVAAHLDPEILLVDEVLAVGDAEFQKKCLGKMGEVAREGRTVLFVSHNMAAISTLCSRSMLLDSGEQCMLGEVQQVIDAYLSTREVCLQPLTDPKTPRRGNQSARITGFWVEDDNANEMASVFTGEACTLCFLLHVMHPCSSLDLGFSIHSPYGDLISVLYSSYQEVNFGTYERGLYTIKCRLEPFNLAPGLFNIRCRLTSGHDEIDWPQCDAGHLVVEHGPYYGTASKGFTGRSLLMLKGRWKTERHANAKKN